MEHLHIVQADQGQHESLQHCLQLSDAGVSGMGRPRRALTSPAAYVILCCLVIQAHRQFC